MSSSRENPVALLTTDIPLGLSAIGAPARQHVPASSKGAIMIDLLRQVVAARRKAATWRELTQHALAVLADVTRDRDLFRQRYHALLDERRRERVMRSSVRISAELASSAMPREGRACV